MKFTCTSCGAELDDRMPKCPYCGRMNPKGAQAEYMDKLYDIQEDMEELKEIPLDTIKKETEKQGRHIRKIILITLIFTGILTACLLLQEKKYDRDHTADLIWEQESFPVMNDMYEKQQFDALESFYMKALEENRPLWNWKYYDAYNEWMEEQK